MTTDPERSDSFLVARMDELFERQGFANTSVDDLRDAAAVSLRTLYRRYGSREHMVVVVLRNRAENYLAQLEYSTGVQDLFRKVADWNLSTSSLGCLFLRARADHPGHAEIEQAVADYHRGLRSRLAAVAEADGLDRGVVEELFVLHEGLIAAAPAIGPAAAYEGTLRALQGLLAGANR